MVADTGNNRTQVFHADNGTLAFAFRSPGTADGEFNRPLATTYSPSGDYIVVVDNGANEPRVNFGLPIIRAQLFHADNGTFVSMFRMPGNGSGELYWSRSVAWSPSGDYIAVADAGNNRIQVFYADDGEFAFKFGGTYVDHAFISHRTYGDADDGEFYYPRSVAWSPSGDYIAVADMWNHRIQMFHADGGTFAYTIGSRADGIFSPKSVDFARLP